MEGRHPFALYGQGERAADMAAKRTHNVGPAASTGEVSSRSLTFHSTFYFSSLIVLCVCVCVCLRLLFITMPPNTNVAKSCSSMDPLDKSFHQIT